MLCQEVLCYEKKDVNEGKVLRQAFCASCQELFGHVHSVCCKDTCSCLRERSRGLCKQYYIEIIIIYCNNCS